jgi:hypothetical protein
VIKTGKVRAEKKISALPPKAEVDPRSCDVAQVRAVAAKARALLDHLVGAGEERR